jgi:hypothetical protein
VPAAWEQLRKHWDEQGLPVIPGNSMNAVYDAERRLGCAFPTDFRDYLLYLDGMSASWPGDQDSEGYCFWRLARMHPVDEEALQDSGAAAWCLFPSAHSYLLIADYMLWCWAFAIRLDGSDEHGCVYAIGQHSYPRLVASSFSDFVALYLADSDVLYPDAPFK